LALFIETLILALIMILILTDSFDVHADIVSQKLSNLGEHFFRLNLDIESLKKTKITFKGSSWSISQDETIVDCSVITCVWPRRVSVQMTLEQQQDITNGFRLRRSEWNKTLFGLYNYLSKSNWMNHVRDATLADNKYYQFALAKEIGFNYPEFITSNNKDVLKEFLINNPSSVIKFMSQDMYFSDKGELLGLYVNKITTESLDNFSPDSENPVTLQRYINKKFEVRYTVIAKEHFSCVIDSQQSDKANVDWRRYDIPNTPHRCIDAPAEIKDKVNALMSLLNLSYGALDFIVDENNDWWFLEINSAGQWLWIEDLSGMDISGSIANWLISHSR
jgi:glutathione synthase/RimK-type ligase-like ATP-grasp enzyme